MTLNDILSTNRIAVNQTNDISSNSMSVRDAALNDLLSNLKPGDNIQAQVVAKNGNTVTLSFLDDILMDAKLSANMNIDIGKLLTFEVKGNDKSLTLSPLFTNMSADPNVLKALDMAGISATEDAIRMTKAMMKAGMSIDRNSINSMFRESTKFVDSSPEDIVDLHKLGIEVNEENLKQIDNYKSLSYQLGDGMRDVASQTSELVNSLVESGDFEKAANIITTLSLALNLEGEEDVVTSDKVPVNNENETLGAADKALKLLEALKTASGDKTDNISDINNDINALNTSNPAQTIVSNKELATFISGLEKAVSKGNLNALKDLLGDAKTLNAIFDALKKEWGISPEDVNEKNVKELYEKLRTQLRQLTDVLESSGLKNTPAANAAANMNNNIDFLNQVNQMYAYIQLPLKLSEGNDAHGDLYVYSNGRKISSKDGKVSALLHLDMEHLGPVDVYVAMDTSGIQNKVSTQFYVQDDSILDFLNDHMDELTKRLQDKGYSCSAKLTVKGTEEPEVNSDGGGIVPIISQSGVVKLAEYSFDVRT